MQHQSCLTALVPFRAAPRQACTANTAAAGASHKTYRTHHQAVVCLHVLLDLHLVPRAQRRQLLRAGIGGCAWGRACCRPCA